MRRKKFVDRKYELDMLEKLWRRKEFSLVVVYGRRRVGKTFLLTRFANGKRHIYYVAVEAPYSFLCDDFSKSVKDFLNLPISGDIVDMIETISKLIKEKVLIVIDEFQFIVEADKSFLSRLQRTIDSILSNKNMMLVICGSAVSFFERELLGYRSPIFGRRTASINLKPLPFECISEFFPKYNIEELITVYGIVGGTPAYLEKLDANASALENIYNIITPGAYLYDEALNLLRQEVREPRTYFSILSNITEGKTTLSEIANSAGIDPRSIIKYISLLEELDIIERIRPIGFKKPVRLKIKDNYFRFWFTYNYRLRSLLESRRINEAYEYIKHSLDKYLSKVYENLILELVPTLYSHGIITTKPIDIGKWWHKDIEIDCIVREPGISTTFIEVKWSNTSFSEARRILKELEQKSTKTGLTSPKNYYLLVVRNIQDSETPTAIDEHHKVIDLTVIESIILRKNHHESYYNKNP